MAIDRSKYRKASSQEMASVTEEINSREGSSNRSEFLRVEAGINVFRIFPAPLKANSSLFLFPKVTSFLPFLENEKDENGNKTGKTVIKRKAIFNAKVHGGLDRDIVEEYMLAVKEKLSAKYSDRKALLKALLPMTDWKTGIKPSNSWCCYARKRVSKDNYVYGRLQLTNGCKKQLDSLSLRQNDSGEAITVDLVSDPDNGVQIQWVSNPSAEDIKARNKITLLFEDKSPLSDEELEWLESQNTLESLLLDSFTRTDFEKQLKGLQKFDKDNGFDVFETPSFQSIIESCKDEIEEKIPNKEEEESEEKETRTTSKVNKKSLKKEDKQISLPTILEEMDKKTLIELAKKLELEDLDIKVTTPPSKARELIFNKLKDEYELNDMDDEEDLKTAVSNIIEEVFDKEEETDSNDEDSSSEEDSSDEDSESPSEDETETEAPRGQSLLEKYRKRNK